MVTSFAVSGEGTLVIGWRSLLLRQYTLDDCKCTRSWKVRETISSPKNCIYAPCTLVDSFGWEWGPL